MYIYINLVFAITMDKSLIKLFNNGVNNGDLTIVSDDGQKINCHSLVFQCETAFWNGAAHFRQSQIKVHSNVIDLDYHSKVIFAALNKMYTSNYVLSNLLPEEIIDLVNLLDELVVSNGQTIKKELAELFYKQLTKENWSALFAAVANSIHHKELCDAALEYYLYEMMVNNKPDMFDLACEENKVLCEFYEIHKNDVIKPKKVWSKILHVSEYPSAVLVSEYDKDTRYTFHHFQRQMN